MEERRGKGGRRGRGQKGDSPRQRERGRERWRKGWGIGGDAADPLVWPCSLTVVSVFMRVCMLKYTQVVMQKCVYECIQYRNWASGVVSNVSKLRCVHTQTTTPITPKRKLSLISQSTNQLPKFSSWKIVQSGCEGAPGSSDKLAVHWGCKKTWNCLLVFCVFVCVCVLEDTKKGNFWIRCVTCLVQINKNVSNFSFIYSRQDTCVQQFATSRDTFQLIIHGSVTSSHRSKMRIQARPELCPLNDWLYIVYLVYKSMKNPKFKSQDNGMHGMQ